MTLQELHERIGEMLAERPACGLHEVVLVRERTGPHAFGPRGYRVANVGAGRTAFYVEIGGECGVPTGGNALAHWKMPQGQEEAG